MRDTSVANPGKVRRRKVTVGVTGGVAVYKALELVRSLQSVGLEPHVVMTRSAERFVTPLSFAAVSGHPVISRLWSQRDSPAHSDHEAEAAQSASMIEHIAEAQTTGALIVAPATANTLAKFSAGVANDFLSAMYLATKAPVVLAPAMNVNMWGHPATQANVRLLEARGATIVPPDDGYLACGMTGSGRLASTQVLVEAVLTVLDRRSDLAGETILITAGGTREAIDPVRFLGNRSSGKMGYALAKVAQGRGARVILITAPTALTIPAGCEVVRVTSAAEMSTAVMHHLGQATVVIGAAAVSDFRPALMEAEKIRRSGPITLHLEPTEDILAEVGRRRADNTLVIAFAAETDGQRSLERGREKLRRKGADAIVVNDVSVAGLGFDSDSNAAIILTEAETREYLPMSKVLLASHILDTVVALRHKAANHREDRELNPA